MDEGDGLDPLLSLLQREVDHRILMRGGLQAQQAGDDLEVVLHPVMDLAQQQVLLSQVRQEDMFLGDLVDVDIKEETQDPPRSIPGLHPTGHSHPVAAAARQGQPELELIAAIGPSNFVQVLLKGGLILWVHDPLPERQGVPLLQGPAGKGFGARA